MPTNIDDEKLYRIAFFRGLNLKHEKGSIYGYRNAYNKAMKIIQADITIRATLIYSKFTAIVVRREFMDTTDIPLPPKPTKKELAWQK